MKRLLRYLNAYKKETVLAPLFKMLEASFELFVPLVVARIVDVGIKNQDHMTLAVSLVVAQKVAQAFPGGIQTIPGGKGSSRFCDRSAQ